MEPKVAKLVRKIAFPCAVCDKACGTKTIHCETGCGLWIHQACVPMSDAEFLDLSNSADYFLCPKCVYTTNKEKVFDFHKCLRRLKGVPTTASALSERRLITLYKAKVVDYTGPNVVFGLEDSVSVEILRKHHGVMLESNSPRSTVGDGNCFYRAASLALFGTQDSHVYLRVLTALELMENRGTYDMSSPSPHTDFINSAVPPSTYDTLLASATTLGSYAEMAIIYALSAAVGCVIQSYMPPTSAIGLGNPYTKTVVGRGLRNTGSAKFTVMWTMMSVPMRSCDFKPNHFVYLAELQDSQDVVNISATSLDAEDKVDVMYDDSTNDELAAMDSSADEELELNTNTNGELAAMDSSADEELELNTDAVLVNEEAMEQPSSPAPPTPPKHEAATIVAEKCPGELYLHPLPPDEALPTDFVIELSFCQKVHRVCIQWVGKFLALLCLLYFFVCSLDFLSSAFRLLGGKAAGSAFSDSSLLQNPIAGLMIGVLATVLVQSSSTSSSIIVTMVASGILEVRPAIPIIMGANIGTSVTNTIVSLAQSPNRDEFRRAFGGATVHDMFNWLSVIVLLPLEIATGYMYHLTSAMVAVYSFNETRTGGANADMLQTLTKPFTELIVQLDSKVIEGIAMGDAKYADSSLLKVWCSYKSVLTEVNITETINTTLDSNSTTFLNVTDLRNITLSIPVKPCSFLFNNRGLSDMMVGIILLVISLVILCGCLILMVKLLNSALKGSMMIVVKKVINADLPGPLSYLTGYIAMLVGAGLTMVVQSSSVFTSALTPLVGIGVIQIERVYPLTLGSNIGTTTTGILASLAASSDRLKPALQIALCHLCFNVTGILLFYPIPITRIPIRLAKIMGNTTAKYRWFAVFYVAFMFFLLPMSVFALSMAGIHIMSIVCGIVAAFCLIVVVINILQKKRPSFLPKVLRNWDFLPCKWMHSLEPYDRVITKVIGALKSMCCSCCKKPEEKPVPKEVEMALLENGVDNKTSPSQICLEIQQDRNLPHGTSFNSLSSDLRTECESGYASRANTPYDTPCISRLPSYVSFIGQIPEEYEH